METIYLIFPSHQSTTLQDILIFNESQYSLCNTKSDQGANLLRYIYHVNRKLQRMAEDTMLYCKLWGIFSTLYALETEGNKSGPKVGECGEEVGHWY